MEYDTEHAKLRAADGDDIRREHDAARAIAKHQPASLRPILSHAIQRRQTDDRTAQRITPPAKDNRPDSGANRRMATIRRQWQKRNPNPQTLPLHLRRPVTL